MESSTKTTTTTTRRTKATIDTLKRNDNTKNIRHKVPWQLEWKNPIWCSTVPPSDTNAPSEGLSSDKNKTTGNSSKAFRTTVGVTSALVDPSELSASLQLQQELWLDNNKDTSNSTTSSSSSLVLSVTLLSSTTLSTTSHESLLPPPVATAVEIDLIQTSSSVEQQHIHQQQPLLEESKISSTTTARLLCSKQLQWPGSIHLDDPNFMSLPPLREDRDEDASQDDTASDTTIPATNKSIHHSKPQNPFVAWWSKTKTKLSQLLLLANNNPQNHNNKHVQYNDSNGIVSATLCRLPRSFRNTTTITNEQQGELASDALDVVSFLSLGLAPPSTLEQQQQQQQQQQPNMDSNLATNMDEMGDDEVTQSVPRSALMTSGAESIGNEEQGPATGLDAIHSSSTRTNATTSHVNDNDVLRLVCVTASGTVYIYSPFQLLFGSDEDEGDATVGDETSANEVEKSKSNPVSRLLHLDGDNEKALSMVMTSILFGPEIHDTLEQSFLPLCQPLATISISSVDMATTMVRPSTSRHNRQTKKDNDFNTPSKDKTPSQQKSKQDKNQTKLQQDDDEDTDDDLLHESTLTKSEEKESDDEDNDDDDNDGDDVESEKHGLLHSVVRTALPPSVFDPSLWNSIVDPSTYIYRTIQNVPTHCCTASTGGIAGDHFIAIAGRGIHPIRQKRRPPQQEQADHPSDGKGANDDVKSTSAKDTIDDKEPSKQKKESRHWWEDDDDENDEKEDIKPAALPTKNKVALAKPKAKRNDMKRWKQPVGTIGGFVTFISLRHNAESRTVFLPFEPLQVSPCQFQGMLFLMVLGKHSTSEAVAIRLDATSNVIVSWPGTSASDVGDYGTTIADQEQAAGVRAISPAPGSISEDMVSGQVAAPKRSNVFRYTVRRFQLLPIEIQAGRMKSSSFSDGRFLLGGSTSPSNVQPPGMVVAYKTSPNSVRPSVRPRSAHGSKGDNLESKEIWVLQQVLHRIVSYDPPISTTVSGPFPDHGQSSFEDKATSASMLFRDYEPLFGSCPLLQIETAQGGGHVAQIQVPDSSDRKDRTPTIMDKFKDDWTSELWTYLGQGWCLFGNGSKVYFICWEGATPCRGALVHALDSATFALGRDRPLVSSIVQLPSASRKHHEHGLLQDQHTNLSFSRPQNHHRVDTEFFEQGIEPRMSSKKKMTHDSIDESQTDVMDDIVVEALESIQGHLDDVGSDKQPLSHGEKSRRLLTRCKSWTELEATHDNNMRFQGQIPVITVRLGSEKSGFNPHHFLTFRELVVNNGPATPFQDVLSWLSHRRDYFTASSIALDLLHDADSLFHLWKNAEKIDEEDEQTKLEGLLDGIQPIIHPNNYNDAPSLENQSALVETGFVSGPSKQSPRQSSLSNESTLTVLADMTVGCLTKGGLAMAKTLEKFLHRNPNYDPATACLMLVATTANGISDFLESATSVQTESKHESVNASSSPMSHHDVLWPVRCLLEVGVSRDSLPMALILLNNTIHDELRGKSRNLSLGGLSSEASEEFAGTRDSSCLKTLCTNIVALIVGSSPEAAELLLGLVDEESGLLFWQSLDHDTQLSLSLIEIDDQKYPLLRHHEVRAWVRQLLSTSFQLEHSDEIGGESCDQEPSVSSDVNVNSRQAPTQWLQNLCAACLKNAGCYVMDLCVLEDNLVPSHSSSFVAHDSDGESVLEAELLLQNYKKQLKDTRGVLLAPSLDSSWETGCCPLDYDVLVPSLLLLESRGASWSEQELQEEPVDYISTKELLDAVCYLTGRTRRRVLDDETKEEHSPIFSFDSSALMKQCALADNVRAGANLIGGTDGFVLLCCDILMQELKLSMDSAEEFLLEELLPLHIINTMSPSESQARSSDNGPSEELDLNDDLEFEPMPKRFNPNNAHHQVLWLLDVHVLSIRTFGEFDTTHLRGSVDPVFAARTLFRVWLLLTLDDTKGGSAWLIAWLRLRLGISSKGEGNEFTASTKMEVTDDNKSNAVGAKMGGESSGVVVSKFRLACAAIIRALVWSSEAHNQTSDNAKEESKGKSTNQDDVRTETVEKDEVTTSSCSTILATAMEIESKFLLQLAQSCCGLVESIPPSVAKEILLPPLG